MPSLRTCWRLTRTERCCTSISLKEKRHGTSGSEQCAIGLFGQRRSGLGPTFLQDGGVRPFAQDPSQDPTVSLHVRSDGQLCPALGKVRASCPLERVDRSPLEVPDDQRQISSSHQQQQLR